jgi:hypothetical protein
MLWWPLTAKQVHAKAIACNWMAPIESSKGDSHRAVPDVCAGINACIYLESGVPGPSDSMIRQIKIDIEIDPLSLGRNLELLVPPNIMEVGTDK